MLKWIELENFKAFGHRSRIDFAPITLVFGENSAGKSSILQSLNLLKQTRESREPGVVLLPRAEAGVVDLGSFQELLFDHDLGRALVIQAGFDYPSGREQRSWFEGRFPKAFTEDVAIELSFHWPEDAIEVRLQSLGLRFSNGRDHIATFIPAALSKEQEEKYRDMLAFRGTRGPEPLRNVQAAKCAWVSDDPTYWKPLYDRATKQKKRIIRWLSGRCREILEHPPFLRGQETAVDDKSRGQPAKRIEEAVAFYESDFTFSQFVTRMRRGEMGEVLGLQGFTPLPYLAWGPINRDAIPEFIGYPFFRGRLEDPAPVSLLTGAWLLWCSHLLEEFLENLFPMGPYRRPPERWYIYTGTRPQDVGYRGHLLPDLLYRSPDLVARTNNWLRRLEIGYAIAPIKPVGRRSKDLFELRLRDTRRASRVDVSVTDVGFGISQILPFVVQALTGTKQTISIEQPEVHVHPRLQADLGDLLAETIRPPQENRFIIETHSEHLVLRMQRLVRNKQLRPDDVCIIFVSREPDGACVRRLRLDDSGDFVDDWPGGFFPERRRELF